MINTVGCAAFSAALEYLKNTVKQNEAQGRRTVVFCEDRLSLAAEMAVCDGVGGTFLTSVYTFARFLAAECGKDGNILSAQGSAMAVRRIIEQNGDKLVLFKKLSAPAAAQSVYDTIALLYSSGVSAEDLKNASGSGLLGGKLHDLALIYSCYTQYLEQNGLQDRNGYLRKLFPAVLNSKRIRGARVIFLGYQAFTHTTVQCLRAAMGAASDVTGIFISGAADIYVNEAVSAFNATAAEFGGSRSTVYGGNLLPEARAIVEGLFNPQSFHRKPLCTSRVRLFEARDETEELEFIAAAIKKQVACGERYAKISVMLPELNKSVRLLNRVFAQYGIPYFADRRISLAEHPLCNFILGFLYCVTGGCRPQDADAVISSPYFPATRREKDVFRNYAIRFMNFRGGIKRQVKRESAQSIGLDADCVEKVQKIFLCGLDKLPKKVNDCGICQGLFEIFKLYGVEDKLQELSAKYRDGYPMQSEFYARVYQKTAAVLQEAEALFEGLNLKDAIKVLKSGFAAAEISLIPPKADAVFVGDIASTVNIGSNVVFAARLAGDVPPAGSDLSLITDREIALLEKLSVNVSPKIRQVNLRNRETVALNLSAFKRELYLSYPMRLGGEESSAGELVSYLCKLFATQSGNELAPVAIGRMQKTGKPLIYYASEKLPALKQLVQNAADPPRFWAIYGALEQNGLKGEADRVLASPRSMVIDNARELFLSRNALSPTVLESYFACPYRNFVSRGLRLQERDEEAVRPLDTGNFIHSVLEELAAEINGLDNRQQVRLRALEIAQKKLDHPPYSNLADMASGGFVSGELLDEAQRVSEGMWEQLFNSDFEVLSAESRCDLKLPGGVKITGKIDRVDGFGDMVRVVDYKTGSVESEAAKLYCGERLQLPLYLLSASAGKRAVGAYYFPASLAFKEKEDGVFRLTGFMDGSDDVVAASDKNVRNGERSRYTEANLGGKKAGSVMTGADFAAFLQYALCVADGGAEEMLEGYLAPVPSQEACSYCKYAGCCNFAEGKNGRARKTPKINCAQIAAIIKGEDDKDE